MIGIKVFSGGVQLANVKAVELSGNKEASWEVTQHASGENGELLVDYDADGPRPRLLLTFFLDIELRCKHHSKYNEA